MDELPIVAFIAAAAGVVAVDVVAVVVVMVETDSIGCVVVVESH